MALSSWPILIIVNPKSGRGKAVQKARQIEQPLVKAGARVRIERTERRGHAEGLARGAVESGSERPRVIVACGGDGIISEIAHALATARAGLGDECPALALAPAGRCNDFARALRISKEPGAIVRTILNGAAQALDLGCVNGRHFCTVAAVGIEAEISRYVDTTAMKLRGAPAYLLATMKVLRSFVPPTVTLDGAFGELKRRVLVASFANTSMYGGAIPIAPRASATDGHLDCCLIDPVGMLRVATLLPRILLGRHEYQREVHFLRAERFMLQADRPLEIWADGEPLGTTPATVEAVGAAIRIMIPE